MDICSYTDREGGQPSTFLRCLEAKKPVCKHSMSNVHHQRLLVVLMNKNARELGAGRAGRPVECPAERDPGRVPAAAPLCLTGVHVQVDSGLQGEGRSCAHTGFFRKGIRHACQKLGKRAGAFSVPPNGEERWRDAHCTLSFSCRLIYLRTQYEVLTSLSGWSAT